MATPKIQSILTNLDMLPRHRWRVVIEGLINEVLISERARIRKKVEALSVRGVITSSDAALIMGELCL